MYGKSKQRRKRFLFPEQNLSYMIQYTVLYGISEHYVCTICTERKQKQKQKQRNLFMFKQLAGYSNRQYNRTMDIAHHASSSSVSQWKTNKKSKSKKRNSASVYINRNKNKKNPSTVCSSNWLVIRQQSCSDTAILTPPMMVDDSTRLYPLEHIVTCN